jgi:hypothetical protein
MKSSGYKTATRRNEPQKYFLILFVDVGEANEAVVGIEKYTKEKEISSLDLQNNFSIFFPFRIILIFLSFFLLLLSVCTLTNRKIKFICALETLTHSHTWHRSHHHKFYNFSREDIKVTQN